MNTLKFYFLQKIQFPSTPHANKEKGYLLFYNKRIGVKLTIILVSVYLVVIFVIKQLIV